MSIENFRIKYLHKSVKQDEKSTIMKKIKNGYIQVYGKRKIMNLNRSFRYTFINTDGILKMKTNCTDPVQKLNQIIKTNACLILVHLIVCMINIHHNSLFQSMQEI